MFGPKRSEFTKALMLDIHSRQPRFVEAVVADARVNSRRRGETLKLESRLELFTYILWLMWESDAFFAHVAYRARVALKVAGVPVLPRLLHRLSMSRAQICIGDPVIMKPGVYIAHGQCVIDGVVEIGSHCVLAPWISIGLKGGDIKGPTIGNRVYVGTGARLIGPLMIGNGAQIGSNAVVTHDVEPEAIVVGIPAADGWRDRCTEAGLNQTAVRLGDARPGE